MGDIALKSHLNEPFSASIHVTDVEKLPDVSCFIAKDTSEIPAFKRANITLVPTSHGYQLNITTHEAMTELVINLQVTYHCTPHLMREYVLLLDPAIIANSRDALKNTSQAALSIAEGNVTQLTDVSQNEVILIAQPPRATKKTVARSVANQKSRRKPKLESVVDRKLMEAYVGKNATESQLAENVVKSATSSPQMGKQAEPRAYLTISNGSMNMPLNSGQQANRLSLRLEREIDFTRPANAQPQITTDVMDEVTVMTNRLAHLEKKIYALQAHNTQLIGAVEKAKKESQALSREWKLRLGLTLLALSLLAVILWFYRAQKTRQHYLVSSVFSDQQVADSADVALLPQDEPVIESEDAENKTLSSAKTVFSNADLTTSLQQALPAENATQPKENVMDHAEVFIAHGRSALAIQLLQNHLADYPTESPEIWLMLLSLLEKEGRESEYNQAVIECNRFFNIKLPNFYDAGSQGPFSIEEYPRILGHLEGVWGTQFAVGFLDNLIYNQQAQPRGGFARDVFEELYFLRTIANRLNPQTSQEQSPFFVKPEANSYWVGEAMSLSPEQATLPHSALLDDVNVQDDTVLKADELYFSSLESDAPFITSSDLTWPHEEQHVDKHANVIEWNLPEITKEQK